MATSRLSAQTLDRILPKPASSVADVEARYPARKLTQGAQVTRIAPSPTGFLHIGGLYVALISERVAHQSGGVFCLRVEDTDRKREVEGARELIMSSLETFNLRYDEGPTPDGEVGQYGPYTQSHRQELYHAYIRQLLETGRAYPCFMTPEELEALAARQQGQKIRPGYYGQWAAWRDRSETEIVTALDQDRPFVIRFRSEGDGARKRTVNDLVRGVKELPENDNDIVIMKRDGLPTYHLAHVVDDHLMGTTVVIRADEWLPSCTLHIQLAEALGLPAFTYGHIAPIQKLDGGSRRKLSKRKDPEASVSFYLENGYPVQAVVEYMLNQGNAGFEAWRQANPHEPYTNFPFDITKLPKNAGALLNLQKLDDISQDTLAVMGPERVYEAGLQWAKTYDPELAEALAAHPDYAIRVLSIERENNKRKDIAKLSEMRDAYGYFFDEIFADIAQKPLEETEIAAVSPANRQTIARAFMGSYDPADTQEIWFGKLKTVAQELGFATDMREYRKNPAAFSGSVADVAMVLRVALVGRNRSPNLHELMQVMGLERLRTRLARLTA